VGGDSFPGRSSVTFSAWPSGPSGGTSHSDWAVPLPTRKAMERWSGDQVGTDLGLGAMTSTGLGDWPVSGAIS
jgi:hypothetical protein